jgi:hypothetical protein
VKYVDWVERVFAAAMARDDEGYGRLSSMDIAEELGFGRPEFDDFMPQRGDARLEGHLDAVKDLEPAGIEMQGNLAQLRITGTARDVRQVGLRQALWPRAFAPVLDERAARLLTAIVERSEEQGDDYARLVEIRLGELWQEITGPVDDEYRSSMIAISVLGDLTEKGLLRVRPAGGTNPEVLSDVPRGGARDAAGRARMARADSGTRG